MNVNLFGLIKFGQKSYMLQLYEDGVLYMNHLSEFLRIEDVILRGDKRESLSEIKAINDIKIFLNQKEIIFAETGRLSLWHHELSGNIYSMYTLFTPEDSEKTLIDSKCKDFGDTFVMITNVLEFIARVKKAASDQNIGIIYGPVEYLDVKQYLGKWSVFKKPSQYSYRNEFRFFIARNLSGPFCLNIGSIKDISFMLDSESLDKLTFERKKN